MKVLYQCFETSYLNDIECSRSVKEYVSQSLRKILAILKNILSKIFIKNTAISILLK